MIHLGLGTSERIKTLTIHWPSGTTQVLQDIAADRHVRITEDNPTLETIRAN